MASCRERMYISFVAALLKNKILDNLCKNENWSEIIICNDVDGAYDIFENKLIDFINRATDKTTSGNRYKISFCPWVTKELRILLKQKHDLYSRLKKRQLIDPD